MQNIFEKTKKIIGLDKKISGKKDKHNRYRVKKQDYRKILVYNAPYVFTCDEVNKLVCKKHCSILIEDDTIKEVIEGGNIERLESEEETLYRINGKVIDFDVVYDAGKRGGAIITPGLMNLHTHPPMYLMRSAMLIGEEESVDQTIAAMPIWEQNMTDEDLFVSTVGDLTEQQKYGITTTLSHYGVFEPIEFATRLTKHALINALSAVSNSHPENSPELIEEFLKRKNEFASEPAVSLHYLYKANPDILRKVKKIVDKNNLLFTCHLAESPKVIQENKKTFGKDEIETLKAFGLLNKRTVVSHGIHLSDQSIKKACDAKLGIVHLPTSNTIHKSGVFPFWKFYDNGGFDRIALGTDSVVSKSRLDVLTEAYQTRMTHLYKRKIKFGSLFKMMTVNAARILGKENKGRILPGMKADLVFWKLKDRGLVPFDEENPMTLIGNMITHNGTTARDVIIEGKFVIKNRKHLFVNESRLLEEIQKKQKALRKRINKK